MYKDKDKQREADKARQKRRRDKIKAKGVTVEGVTEGVTQGDGIAPKVQHFGPIMPSKPANFGQSDCQCKHCQQARVNKSKNIINHGLYKTFDQLMSQVAGWPNGRKG